jgi:hypothetical protein
MPIQFIAVLSQRTMAPNLASGCHASKPSPNVSTQMLVQQADDAAVCCGNSTHDPELPRDSAVERKTAPHWLAINSRIEPRIPDPPMFMAINMNAMRRCGKTLHSSVQTELHTAACRNFTLHFTARGSC